MMKKYTHVVCLLLLVSHIGNAQYKADKSRNSDLFYQDKSDDAKDRDSRVKPFVETDQMFAVTEVPQAYANESAVVLAQKTEYNYKTNRRVLSVTETNRKRIKLMDKAAVNAFSELYFYSASSLDGNIRIVKPNGKVNVVAMSDAVKVTTAVPEFYRSYYSSSSLTYYKVAVSDLEPGDIIDYSTKSVETKYNSSGATQAFSPILYTLNNSYTILKHRLEFRVDKGYYVNLKSVNGAPELKKDLERSGRRYFTYVLEDGERARVKSSLWVYKLRELPHIKFQVFYSHIGKEHKTKHFLGKPTAPNKQVTAEDIVKKVNLCYQGADNSFPYSYYHNAISFMDKNHKKVSDPEEYAKLAYYYLRNIMLVEPLYKGMDDAEAIRDDVFTMLMIKILEHRKFDYELYVSVPREDGPLDGIILYDELTWFLKVKGKYIYSFDRLKNYGEPDPSLQGVKAYKITLSSNQGKQKYEIVDLPVTTAKENNIRKVMDIRLDEKKESLYVNASTQVEGLMKRGYAYKALSYTDYKKEDYKYFGGVQKAEEGPATKNKAKLAEYERKNQVTKEEDEKAKLDLMKEELKGDYTNVVEYKNFTLLKDGRSDVEPTLTYKEDYVLGDLVKKAGPNYIVEVGALLGSQVEILDADKERQYDINMAYPKTIVYQLKITIPDGYRVEGLNGLKMNVVNETGSFISTGKIENNTLIITTEKSYHNIYNKKEDWQKMLAFLDAAYDFTQKKIVLKK
jgi:hypothetical protein